MKNGELDARLTSAAGFVRQGAVFADIGTDHAYLPIFLLSEGRIERAVCSDVNRGPLNSAMKNAREMSFFDKMEFVLANGAEHLSDSVVTDVAVCGMGGELIARIIEDAPHLRSGRINLILQPMSKHAHLRRALAKLGYFIIAEDYSRERDKIYLTILASYDGVSREISELEAEIGRPPYPCGENSPKAAYISAKLKAISSSRDGKRLGGESTEREDLLIRELSQILVEIRNGDGNDS